MHPCAAWSNEQVIPKTLTQNKHATKLTFTFAYQGHWDTVTDIQTTLLHLWRSPSAVCVTWKSNLVILIMYIYHALINALSAHIMHINLNAIYVRRGQSYQNNLPKALYGNTHTHAYTCMHMHKKNDCNRNWVYIDISWGGNTVSTIYSTETHTGSFVFNTFWSWKPVQFFQEGCWVVVADFNFVQILMLFIHLIFCLHQPLFFSSLIVLLRYCDMAR